MSSKYLTILLAVAALLLTTSCSGDDMDVPVAEGLVSAQVTASISNGKTESRVTNSGNTSSFASGDKIHVVTGSSTYDYTLQSDGSTWSSDNPYYFTNADEVTFQAWYASSATGTESSISINTTGNQATTTDGWCQWDILVSASATANVTSPSVSLTFSHIMSKVTLAFTAGGGIDDLTSLTGYTLSGLITDATFSTSSCSLTNGDTSDDISQTLNISSGTTYSCPLILVPQTGISSLTLEVTYNDQTFTATLPLTSLVAATHYTVPVTITRTGLEVGTAEISDWTSTDAQTGSSSLSYTYTDEDGVRTYTVYNENGLKTWGDYVNAGNWTANCILATDITMTYNWTPVGYEENDSEYDTSHQYLGTFDGNGKTITNLSVNAPSRNNVGFIGKLGSGGVVKNVTLVDVEVYSTYGWSVGAVVGKNYGGTVTACNVTGNVCGCGFVGGIVGSNYKDDNSDASPISPITGCSFLGTVYGLINSYTDDNGDTQTYGGIYIGGVAGANYNGTITACYSTGTVGVSTDTSTGSSMGGIVGANTGTITACYSTAAISNGGEYIGGIAGSDDDYTTISACYYSNNDYGIGYASGGSGSDTEGVTTQVDGSTVSWTSTALSAMNEALSTASYNWEYVENTGYTSGDYTSPPLLLEESTTSTE